ncbi:Tetratricopeptide-like helical domain superfamily [Sesbania bispinosa]|nr:Tetratricopeptide-like helical domain superfamily [Sesbania bispinosa]
MNMVKHPNIVNSIKSWLARTKIYITMELIRGGELFNTDNKGMFEGRLSQNLLRGKLNSAAFSNAALNYAHGYDELPERENEGDASGFDFLHFMEERGVRANSQTYLWLLEGCLNSGSFSDGWKLHGKILKMGFVQRFVAEKLTGHVLGLFQRMMKENVKPDERTFAGVLRGCSGNAVPFHYVEQIHARTITHGFESSPFICNPLIDLYFKNGFLNSAKKVFDNLHDRDSVSWVAMLSGLSQSGYEEEAILLFFQMHTSGISPTPYIFSSVLSACTKIEFFELGEQLHGLVLKQGFSSETYVCNALVTLYSRMGNLISAEQVFSAMSQRDGVSYNSLISGLAQQGHSDRALELYKKMHLDCLKPDCVTVASLLSACASAGALLIGKQFHSYAVKAGMSSDLILEGIQALDQGQQIHAQSCVSGYSDDLSIGNALVSLYARCGKVGEAYLAFNKIFAKDNISWNSLISGFGQSGHCEEALNIIMAKPAGGPRREQPASMTKTKIVRIDCYFCFVIEVQMATTQQISGTSTSTHTESLPLQDRVAIVTGSSRGIGREVALHLSSLGARLVVNYSSSDSGPADSVVAEINASAANRNTPRAIAVRADISEPAQVQSLFDSAERAFDSPVHILVNSAGTLDSTYPSVANTSVESFDRVFSVNARGAFLCAREAANRLKRGGGGRIILFSSSQVAALRPGFAAYTAAKAAVEAMTKILAKELKGTGITANCVAPGPIATELFFGGRTEEQVKKIIDESPLGRLGETKDVAPLVGFLASDAGEWVNGQIIRVNGGYV